MEERRWDCTLRSRAQRELGREERGRSQEEERRRDEVSAHSRSSFFFPLGLLSLPVRIELADIDLSFLITVAFLPFLWEQTRLRSTSTPTRPTLRVLLGSLHQHYPQHLHQQSFSVSRRLISKEERSASSFAVIIKSLSLQRNCELKSDASLSPSLPSIQS